MNRASSSPSPGQRRPTDGVSAELAAEVLDAGRQAAAGYLEMGRFLTDELLPKAPEADGCGREKYGMWSRAFLGAAVDFEEAYAWGQDELARIGAEMQRTADLISPGATVREAMDILDHDPSNVLAGPDELRRWMQLRADEAVRELVRHALRHPGPAAHHRVPDRAHQRGRHLLHRAQRRPVPARPHVVVGARGRRLVHDLARAHDRLPRGRARASPPGRPDGVQPGRAQPLAPAGLLGLRARRGLGAVRRAADGRPRLPGRPGRAAGDARRAVAAGRARGHRHRRAPRAARARVASAVATGRTTRPGPT